jgi:hypothetical protein
LLHSEQETRVAPCLPGHVLDRQAFGVLPQSIPSLPARYSSHASERATTPAVPRHSQAGGAPRGPEVHSTDADAGDIQR